MRSWVILAIPYGAIRLLLLTPDEIKLIASHVIAHTITSIFKLRLIYVRDLAWRIQLRSATKDSF
jgi:hypothetical protein